MNGVAVLQLAKNYTDTVLESSAKIYGVQWDKGETPTLTRTHDAVGMVANAGVGSSIVVNDFDNAQIFREIGEVVDTLGNVFVRIPKFYIRKINTAVLKAWQVSKYQYPGFYLPWCFWDFTNGLELPHIDIGKHKASLSGDNKLQSISGVAPLSNKHIVDFRTYAQANNAGGLLGYQQLDIHVVDLLRTLMFIEFSTLDIQTIMKGYTEGYYGTAHVALVADTGVNSIVITNAQGALYEVGQTVSIHLAGATNSNLPNTYGRTITNIEADTPVAGQTTITFDGDPIDVALNDYIFNTGFINGFSSQIAASSGSIVSNSTGKFSCMYRGIESPFGDMWQFVDGANITSARQAWVTENAEDYASNVFAHPYKQLGYTNATSDNYVKEMGFDPNYPFAEFPVTVGGGADATKYYADYYYQASSTNYIARFGGNWNNGVTAGLSYWYLNITSSFTFVVIGGRLLKKAL